MSAVNESKDFFSVQSTLAIAIVLPLLDIIAVYLRFYTRRRQKLSLQADDWFTLTALLLVIALGVDLIAGVALKALAYPVPLPAISDEAVRAIAISSQTEWAFYMISTLALGCIKLSFLYFYRRIFCATRMSSYSVAIYVIIGIVTAWTISFFFAFLFACKGDFAAWWGSYENLVAKCLHTYTMLYGLAVSDVITDGIIILLPLPMIWTLQLATGKKIAVSIIFLIGLIVVAASVARLVFVIKSTGNVILVNEDLFITRILWWGMLETGLGLLVACLPTLRFLLKCISPEAILSSVRSIFKLASRGSQQSHARLPENAPLRNASTASHAHALAARTRSHSDSNSCTIAPSDHAWRYGYPPQEKASAENSIELQHMPV